jgi:hypothetical protein
MRSPEPLVVEYSAAWNRPQSRAQLHRLGRVQGLAGRLTPRRRLDPRDCAQCEGLQGAGEAHGRPPMERGERGQYRLTCA